MGTWGMRRGGGADPAPLLGPQTPVCRCWDGGSQAPGAPRRDAGTGEGGCQLGTSEVLMLLMAARE